jgi:chemotaxis protein MotA
MDFTSIVGFIVGLGLVIYGIVYSPTTGVVFGELWNFYDLSSIFITFGGTIAATVIAFPISYFKNIPKHLRIVTQKKIYYPQIYIDKIVKYAQEARKKGLLSLEDMANAETDVFLKDSIMLIVDAIDPAKTKEMLDNQLDNLVERHSHGWQFYEKFATYAPAFGMIGTLIGLINMLAHMDMNANDGATKMAQGMATALVTTFYGSMLANLLLTPFAHKLHMRHDEEMICKEIVVQGVLAIQAGDNPTHIEERLNAFVCEKERISSRPGMRSSSNSGLNSGPNSGSGSGSSGSSNSKSRFKKSKNKK